MPGNPVQTPNVPTGTQDAPAGTPVTTIKPATDSAITVTDQAINVNTPTPRKDTYPAGYVYKQRASEVQRWYNAGEYKGYKHDGYSTDSFAAIWLIGFYDNEYSTNQDEKGEPNEGIYGPDLTVYRGGELSIEGEFWYEGEDADRVLLQINYTSPDDCPMLCRWENSKLPNTEADGLNIDPSESSRDKIGANTRESFRISSFTIPVNADAGNYGIYLYFPNKPGGSLIYNKDNTFHFKNFAIKRQY